MNKVLYALESKFRQRIANKESLLLSLVILAIGFIFVIMFVSKWLDAKAEINRIDWLYRDEDVLVITDYTNDLFPDMSPNAERILTDELLVGDHYNMVSGITNHYHNYIPPLQSERDLWQLFDTRSDVIIAGENLKRQHNLAIGDEIHIGESIYHLIGFTLEPLWQNRYVTHFDEVDNQLQTSLRRSEYLINISEVSSQYQSNPTLADRARELEASTRGVQNIISVVTLFLLFIMLINVSLVLAATLEQVRHADMVRTIFGQGEKLRQLLVLVDTLLLVTVSFHLGVGVYYIIRGSIPVFFYFELTWPVYTISWGLIIIVSSVLAAILSRWQGRRLTIQLLRG